jgi:hypothetical protein
VLKWAAQRAASGGSRTEQALDDFSFAMNCGGQAGPRLIWWRAVYRLATLIQGKFQAMNGMNV